eukprot:30381_1
MADVVDLKKVKEIKQKQKDIVYGYIKGIQWSLFPTNDPFFNINQLIKDLCLLYFVHQKDYFTINNERTFNYIYDKHKDWYHIFGEYAVQRGMIDTYTWKIETSGTYSGRLGIVDDTNINDGSCTITNGKGMYTNKHVICAGNHCGGTRWYGNVYGKTNTKELYDFFEQQDTVTITVNFKDNTVTFNSKENQKRVVKQLKDTTNCVKFVGEFTSHNLLGKVQQDATMTML